MLNNWAFAFNISVPVHIILRSFGSVTTMAAGWFRGKRYTTLQVLSVAGLTMGVMVSAWADAQSKVWLYVCTIALNTDEHRGNLQTAQRLT
jgi:drug/metabolite transporter (DMT)-like permease